DGGRKRDRPRMLLHRDLPVLHAETGKDEACRLPLPSRRPDGAMNLPPPAETGKDKACRPPPPSRSPDVAMPLPPRAGRFQTDSDELSAEREGQGVQVPRQLQQVCRREGLRSGAERAAGIVVA